MFGNRSFSCETRAVAQNAGRKQPSGCCRPRVALQPPVAIPGLAFPLASLAILISEIYSEKIAADAFADGCSGGSSGGSSKGADDGGGFGSLHRPDLETVVADFFASR